LTGGQRCLALADGARLDFAETKSSHFQVKISLYFKDFFLYHQKKRRYFIRVKTNQRKGIAMTTAKERIQRDLQGDLFARNHPTRSYFRGWLDGSYLGERHYNYNLGKIKPHVHKSGAALEKALRPFVINAFCAYTAHDAQCSYGTRRKLLSKR
jgi:hypothetical protein